MQGGQAARSRKTRRRVAHTARRAMRGQTPPGHLKGEKNERRSTRLYYHSTIEKWKMGWLLMPLLLFSEAGLSGIWLSQIEKPRGNIQDCKRQMQIWRSMGRQLKQKAACRNARCFFVRGYSRANIFFVGPRKWQPLPPALLYIMGCCVKRVFKKSLPLYARKICAVFGTPFYLAWIWQLRRAAILRFKT